MYLNVFLIEFDSHSWLLNYYDFYSYDNRIDTMFLFKLNN